MTAPEFLKFTRQWIGACDKVLKDKGSIYIACSYHNIGESMMVLKQLGYQVPIFLLFGINFFQSFIVKSPTTVFNCPNNKLGRMCKMRLKY
jgi:hypothetical protein